MCEHGTKITLVFLPADGEASWSLLPSTVSLLSGSTVQPENLIKSKCKLKVIKSSFLQSAHSKFPSLRTVSFGVAMLNIFGVEGSVLKKCLHDVLHGSFGMDDTPYFKANAKNLTVKSYFFHFLAIFNPYFGPKTTPTFLVFYVL